MATKLTVKQIEALPEGFHSTGDTGLYIRVRGDSRVFIYKFQLAGKRREMGLGKYPEVSLSAARDKALEARALIKAGKDPIIERDVAKIDTIVASGITFEDVAEEYVATIETSLSNPKHRAQWRSTLSTYAYPKLGAMPIDRIETQHILAAISPIWTSKNETAYRLLGRIKNILDFAAITNRRSGANPAIYDGHIDQILKRKTRSERTKHHPALPYAEVPAFMEKLGEANGITPLALAFCILTAARSGEVRGAKWSEIEGDVWVIPASRMKARKEHRVPLTPQAMAILEKAREWEYSDWIFPSPRVGKTGSGMLSDMSLTSLVRRYAPGITVHGFRSTFRDWIYNETDYPGELAEAALAHTVGSVERSYRRGDALERRREMMQAWALYVENSLKI